VAAHLTPEEYAEEAAYVATLLDSASGPMLDVLELGSGGGHNAVHLKARYAMTLVELSEEMLAVSRRLNLLRNTDGTVRVVHETHRTGLFSRDVWLHLLAEAGFEPEPITEQTTEDRTPRELFVGHRRG
jgi:SAM-dependent methyltransferase